MPQLTPEEQLELDALLAKRDAPDDHREHGEVNYFVDLSDEQAVERAVACGLLDPAVLEKPEPKSKSKRKTAGKADDDQDDDDEPESPGEEKRREQRRRLTMADRMMGSDGSGD